ncbi:MAG: ArnT family glycosyltransferase [Promethearchaeota archaeon]
MINIQKIFGILQKLTTKQIMLIIFLMALSLRVITIILLGQDVNSYENGEIALNLVNGNGFSMEFFNSTKIQETCAMVPVYPFLIAFSYLIFGVNSSAILAIQIFQAIIGAITIYPIFLLTKRLFSNEVAIVSCVIFCIYPDFLISAYYIHTLTFVTFIITLLIYFSIVFLKSPSYKSSIILGLLYGFSLLLEPLIISILGIFLIWTFIYWIYKFIHTKKVKKEINFRKNLMYLSCIVFIGVLVILPWQIRCSYVYKEHFVFLKFSGYNIWRGNNINYTITGLPSSQNMEYGNLTNEEEIDQFYFNLAKDYIFSNLPETIGNCFKKAVDLWWFPQILPEQSPTLRKLIYLPLLILFCLSLIYGIKRLKKFFPLLIPLISFTLVYSISIVLPRYRVPVQPIIFIFSAYAFVKIYNIIRKKLLRC